MNVPAYGYDEIIKYINEKESDNLKFVKIDDNFYKKRIYAIGATHDGNIIISEENNKTVIYFKGKDINQLKQLLNSSALIIKMIKNSLILSKIIRIFPSLYIIIVILKINHILKNLKVTYSHIIVAY